MNKPGGNGSGMRVSARRFTGWAFLLLLLLGLSAAPTSSASDNKEKPYALLFGTVWGPDDRPVYGVHIFIRRSDKKKPQWDVYSNHMGEFAQRLPAGKAEYIVSADLKGFKSMDGRQLSLGDEVTAHIEYDERLDIGVHLK